MRGLLFCRSLCAPGTKSGSPNICPTPAVEQQVHDSFVAPLQRMAKSGKGIALPPCMHTHDVLLLPTARPHA